jgi:hypothetical protein
LDVLVIRDGSPLEVPVYTSNSPDTHFFLRYVEFSGSPVLYYIYLGAHYRFMWDDIDSSIKCLPPLMLQSDSEFNCYSCDMKASNNNSGVVRRETRGNGDVVLHFRNNVYHTGDFVYIARPTFDAPDLLRVGQIRSLGGGSTIVVRKFKRCKDSEISVRLP